MSFPPSSREEVSSCGSSQSLAIFIGTERRSRAAPFSPRLIDVRRSIAEPVHKLADVLRPQVRVRHCQMAKRSLGAGLKEEATKRDFRHQVLEDVKRLGIELVIVKIE